MEKYCTFNMNMFLCEILDGIYLEGLFFHIYQWHGF
jgi:hypothetical protein